MVLQTKRQMGSGGLEYCIHQVGLNAVGHLTLLLVSRNWRGVGLVGGWGARDLAFKFKVMIILYIRLEF